MNRKTYDAIVVGLGGVGSAAAYHLAKRGVKTLGIDQFSPPHSWGSSHGQTRVIRQAYFEHQSYVPLLKQAYHLWDELESETGQSLFHRAGLLQLGPSDGVVIPGVLRSARQHNLPIEELTIQEATKRFPGIKADESWSAVLETNAGYLLVERCIEAHLQQATKFNATLVLDECVQDWQADEGGVVVRTSKYTFVAKRLVLASGPWSARWLREANSPLTVLRKHIYWFGAPERIYGEAAGFPCFFCETPQGFFYGTPMRDDLGVKVARHSGGEVIDSIDGDHHREDEDDRKRVETFLAKHLPDMSCDLRKWSGCYYTMTSDENFVVDQLPQTPAVTIIAGLSGHGFKFAGVLGKIASHLACGDDHSFDLDFLRLARRA